MPALPGLLWKIAAIGNVIEKLSRASISNASRPSREMAV